MRRISGAVRPSLSAFLLCIAFVVSLAPASAGAPLVSLVPYPKPDNLGKQIGEPTRQRSLVAVSLIPRARPKNLKTKFAVVPKRKFRRKGSVCGVKSIKGQKQKGFTGKISGCGIADPVRVTSVAGIALQPSAILDCTTAKALEKWVGSVAEPAFRNNGGGLAQLRVAASYSCRTRNSRKGAKISEHAKGHAIDISGFVLRNGEVVNVLNGWHSARNGRTLKQVHRSACGTFGTVLGPRSDAFHRDHFHFDTARYRRGSYCR